LNIYYKSDSHYLANPFDHIYQNHDVEVSNRPEILELEDLAIDLEKEIEGSFNLEFLTLQIKHNQLAFAHTGLIAAQIKFKKFPHNK
jgi:hypothetical protein